VGAPERVVVYVDGGARGNPGPAGIGVVVTDEEGTELARANDYIGIATNNVAEYRALLLGAEQARALGADEAAFVNDSQLIARQLTGEYRVKSGDLRPLHEQALQRLSGFRSWSIRSVPRERNELADALVNEAIDARSQTECGGPAHAGPD
jgi:ribonuclease HI